MSNLTTVTEFLLTRFSDVWEFSLTCHAIYTDVLSNTFGKPSHCHSTHAPTKSTYTLYLFIRNLSSLDMCFISVTIPKACVIFLHDNRVISMFGCAAQTFSVIAFSTVELVFLTIMAHDCYVAICQPLHYPMIMNPRVCKQMTLASILSGLAFSGIHTSNTFQLHFCESNMIHQFFCDIPPLLKLSCSDTFSNEILIFICMVGMGGGCLTFITKFYIHIFSTVLKFPTREEQGNVFSTCVPHILVVTVFVISAAVVYVKPASNSPKILDMLTSVFYCTVPPFLNPIIYSLRNKQIKEAVKRVIKRMIYPGKSIG